MSRKGTPPGSNQVAIPRPPGTIDVTVTKLDGSPLWGASLDTQAEARVYVLENALPATMRLGDAVKAADRVLAGERVEVGGLIVAVAADA